MKRIHLTVPEELSNQRLDQVLATLLPESPEVKAMNIVLSKGKVRKLIVAGAVYLGGGRVRIASKACRAGARLEVYLDPRKILSEGERVVSDGGENVSREWKLSGEDVVFEDEWIIGIRKPAGLPTQPTVDEARANLFALLKKFLWARDGVEPYVGLHHRLDRDTSGVMVFTKKKDANAEIGRAFQEHLARKTYFAIVSTSGELPENWQVDNFLSRDKVKAGKMRSVHSGGDRAMTDFRRISSVEGFALIEANPRTGRMHQIRVHLAESGAPIVGDRTYGGIVKTPANTPISRVMLHAARLTFPHPVSKLEITFNASLTPDFEKCLSQLRIPVPPSGVFGSEPHS